MATSRVLLIVFTEDAFAVDDGGGGGDGWSR